MVHIYTKYNDDVSGICSVITKKVHFSFIRDDFEVFLWRHRWRHHHENIFSCTIWNDLSISDVKLKLHWIFKKNSKWRNFRAGANFFVGSVTGSWAPYQESQEHALHFELLIDVLAQKLTELCQFKNLTYFLTSWPSYLTFNLEKL